MSEVTAKYTVIDRLIGKTLKSVERVDENRYDGDALIFVDTDNTRYTFRHYQDCCESVSIEDIAGELDDLVGSPLTMAEVASQESETDYESQTWTFYKFATIKGYVTVRWHGSSNGYYSESVYLDIEKANQ